MDGEDNMAMGGGNFNLAAIVNPYDDRENMAGACNVTSKIEYDNSVIVRIVYIPSFAVLLISSTFLIYVIAKFLKPLIKIYMSVLFYAACQLLLVLCLILSIVSSRLYDESMVTCRVTEPLYSVGMMMPGYAVLAITVIRYLFLKYPMNWRNILKMRYQLTGFFALFMLSVFLSNLPNFGMCGYVLYARGSQIQCRYNDTGTMCSVFYGLYITFGFALPPLIVIVLYGMIYKIITKHRVFMQENSRARSSSRTISTRVSKIGTSTASEKLLNSSGSKGSSDKAEKERSSIPWSILAILVLNLLSSLPWIPQALYPDLFYGCQPGEIVLLVDVLWSVLMISVAISPLTYLLTTPSVREQLKQYFVCQCRAKNSDHQFENLSNV